MIDPERILGAMLSKGFDSGRRRRPSLGMGSMLSGSVKGAVGLGIIGIAIAAFDHYMNKQKAVVPPLQPQAPQGAGPAGWNPASAAPSAPPPPPPGVPDSNRSEELRQAATLLIRAMIAAANADGSIDEAEKAAILGRLEAAGVSPEERAFVTRELNAPPSVDSLLPAVKTPELAREFYAASLLAVTVDTQAEKDYLHYLRLRLGLSDETALRIEREIGA